MALESIDYAFILFYFMLVFGVAWWSFKSNKEKSDDYFLAGRNLGWFFIGASLFASNIGSEHLIGLAGAGASSGVPVAQFEILAGVILLLLGWVFVPFYIKSGVVTMPEFLEKRYSRGARNYLTYVSIIGYVITKISATIFAGAVVFEVMGLDFWKGAILIVLFTGIYSAIGGLRAVIYTDTLQVIIMILGSLFVTFLGLSELGGWSGLQSSLDPEFFNLWKSIDHPDFPWTGVLFGAPILGVWYWCTDQFIVQRVLSARNLQQARRGSLFAGFLKMLPLFLFVVPGMIALALSQKGILSLEKSDQALPVLMGTLLPSGLKGFVIAGLLSAIMSSLSSVFNSCSTLITFDIYKVRKPQATEKELYRVGQISTVVIVIFGLMWIPLMKFVSGGLFTYIQSVQAYISPPIASVFLLGLFFKKFNARGAMAALLTGFLLGLARLVAEINKESLSGFFLEYASINFLHFAFFLFVICSTVLVIVSLASLSTESKDLSQVTYEKGNIGLLNRENRVDFILSLALVIIILSTWYYFS